MNKKSIITPSFLKQKAKNLQKEKLLKWHQALDETSKQFGYSNYKNYLNILEVEAKELKQTVEVLLKKISLENDISKKEKLAISLIQNFKVPFQDLLGILKQFQHSEKALQAVCESLDLKSEIQKFMLNDFLTDESKIELQSFPLKQHFIAKEVFVKNLSYEIDGDLLCVGADYDLKLEFDGEVPDEHRHSPYSNPAPMFGDFDITIDKNKKITIGNVSIGE